MIFDDVKMASAENGTETQLTLLLTTYNAGYYRCQFHYQNRTSDYLAYADFQIDPEEKGFC